MSHELLYSVLPIGSNWIVQLAGSALTVTGDVAFAEQAPDGVFDHQVKCRKERQRRARNSEEHDRLAPDNVRQPGEENVEDRARRDGLDHQQIDGDRIDLEDLFEERGNIKLAVYQTVPCAIMIENSAIKTRRKFFHRKKDSTSGARLNVPSSRMRRNAGLSSRRRRI